MIGRLGSGRARKLSMSFPRSATMSSQIVIPRRGRKRARRMGSAPRGKIRSEPRLDVFRDLLRGAVFGVAVGPRARKALIGTRHVVGDAGEGRSGHHRFIGRDLD